MAAGFHEAMTRSASRKPGASPGATSSIKGCSGLMRMQAAKWFGFISARGGTISLQASIANGQLVWKRHPDGGLIGEGTSPSKTMRWRDASISGSGTGTAEMSVLV